MNFTQTIAFPLLRINTEICFVCLNYLKYRNWNSLKVHWFQRSIQTLFDNGQNKCYMWFSNFSLFNITSPQVGLFIGFIFTRYAWTITYQFCLFPLSQTIRKKEKRRRISFDDEKEKKRQICFFISYRGPTYDQ